MRDASKEGPKGLRRVWLSIIVVLALGLIFFTVRHFREEAGHDHASHAKSDEEGSGGKEKRRTLTRAQPLTPLREGDPQGAYHQIFDKLGNRFLLSRNGPKNLIPDSDAPAGMDLWITDENGQERLIAENVYRAKFSPDGSKVAYTTDEAVMHIETLAGEKVKSVEHSYDPSWSADSSKVVFCKAQEDKHINFPETLQITTLDVNTGDFKALTDGSSDDVRPHFSPEDPNCIVFVNGGRTGLASFWRVCGDRPPEQITNLGMQGVNEAFVPTPYKTSFFERGWFIYDFKNGDTQETWAVRMDPTGKAEPRKIGEGIEPRFGSDGTLTTVKYDGERANVLKHAFP